MATSLLLARITVLLAGALGVGYFWRQSPRRVHQMWTFVFLTTLALPLIAERLPALRIPAMTTWIQPQSPVSVPASTTDVGAVADAGASAPAPAVVEPPPEVRRETPAASASPWRVDFRRMALAVWLAGALTALTLKLLSLWRVRRLTDTTAEISDPIWRQEAAEIGRRLGFSREVRLLTERSQSDTHGRRGLAPDDLSAERPVGMTG